MKKLTAIFFLLTFTWLQYSRQLSFFHCKITNAFSAVQCDCEKITGGPENKDEQNLPAQKITVHTIPDEYYTPVATHFNFTALIKVNGSYAKQHPSKYAFCYCNNLLKPPQA